MIHALTLTNFYQHRTLRLDFGSGFSVLRGANESGKSHALYGIAYAMFGVKGIPDSLDDVVTWGEPVNSLKVTLAFSVDGVQYSVTRSKASCQLDYEGGTVTGQTEVTAFIARLLKVDAGAAARLTISNQSAIRGALEAGPKATTELIEKLAEFDQIDNLIELMQEKLTLGNTASAAAQVEAAQERLKAAQQVEQPDFLALGLGVTRAQGTVESAKIERAKLDSAYAIAQTAHAMAVAQEGEIQRNQALVARAQLALGADGLALSKLKIAPVERPEHADDRMQDLLEKKAAGAGVVAARVAYREAFPLLGDCGTPRFFGTAQAWQDRLRKAEDDRAFFAATLKKDEIALASLKPTLLHGNCSWCGQDFSDLPEVKAKNAVTKSIMDDLTVRIASGTAGLKDIDSGITELKSIQSGGRPTLAIAQKHAQYLTIDESVYPPLLQWKGNPPVDGNLPEIETMIRDLREQVRAADAYDAALTSAVERAQRSFEVLQEAQARVVPVACADVDTALAAMERAHGSARDQQVVLEGAQQYLVAREGLLSESRRQWTWAQREVTLATATAATASEGLKSLEFNNTLLKKVRAARPVISDRLWSIVLQAVGAYFSEIRGSRSRVTKDSSGFQVDGHPVTTLSGSALDSLGLAIRVALVRTFLPSSPFLVLDEPSSAMDEGRTSNMLGFLSTCGFGQVIMCSHDSLSESVADQVIVLGE